MFKKNYILINQIDVIVKRLGFAKTPTIAIWNGILQSLFSDIQVQGSFN